ncbi:MAG: hypothetical protein HFJ12_03165 [Bacilli bacterium]|nr:hypothetical protein [Bacilli bacterium]
MDINIYDQITLSDNEVYLIAGKTNYLNKVYYFLVNMKNTHNIKYCEENIKNHSIIEVNDSELKQVLFPLFLESFQNSSVDIMLKEIENK